jgi:hypothetical protein
MMPGSPAVFQYGFGPTSQFHRYVVRASLRPLRVAVCLRAPVSTRGLRDAVDALTSAWGGADSVLVTGDSERAVGADWLPMLQAYDPDVVMVPRTHRSLRALFDLREFLSSRSINPRWIVPFSRGMEVEVGWRMAAPPGERAVEERYRLPASVLRSPNPIMTAVTGLTPRSRARTTASTDDARDPLEREFSYSLVRGSRATAASTHPVGIAIRPLAGSPYFVYPERTIEAAIWLWNLRTFAGVFRQWQMDDFVEVVDDLRPIHKRRPPALLHLGPLAAATKRKLASMGNPFSVIPIQDYPLSPRTRYIVHADYEATGTSTGQVPLPPMDFREGDQGLGGRRFPRLTMLDVVAVDLVVRRADSSTNLDVAFAPVMATHDTMHSRANLGLGREPRGRIRSRARRNGHATLFVSGPRPMQDVRLEVADLGSVFRRLDPSRDYERSDKGIYARWMADHAGGLGPLREFLVDPRSRALLEEFKTSHRGRKPRLSYRRFLTYAEMLGVWRRLRSIGALPRRIPHQPTDEVWLNGWLQTHVDSGLLRQGLHVRCNECRQGAQIPFGSFSNVFACPRCGATQPTPAVPKTGYWLAEVAHLFLDSNGDIPALALAALSRRAGVTFSYDFDHNVIHGAGQRELDVLALVDGRPAIGEAKVDGAFDEADLAFLEKTVKRLRFGIVVLATGNECEGGCTENCAQSANRDVGATSDSALPFGGPRERVEQLRSRLAGEGRSVVVACRGELFG